MNTTPLLSTIAFLAMTGAAFAGPAKHAESWASGQIARVDPATHSVVIKQGTHEMTYQLASDAAILIGGHAQKTPDLNADVGKNVRVRYSTSGLHRIADRLEITGASPAAAVAQKAPGATPAKPIRK